MTTSSIVGIVCLVLHEALGALLMQGVKSVLGSRSAHGSCRQDWFPRARLLRAASGRWDCVISHLSESSTEAEIRAAAEPCAAASSRNALLVIPDAQRMSQVSLPPSTCFLFKIIK